MFTFSAGRTSWTMRSWRGDDLCRRDVSGLDSTRVILILSVKDVIIFTIWTLNEE